MSKRSHAFLVSVASIDIESGTFVLVKIDDQFVKVQWLNIAGYNFYIPEGYPLITSVPPDLEIIGIIPTAKTFTANDDHYSEDQNERQKSN